MEHESLRNVVHSPFADAWALDPAMAILNHGSFGACPTIVLERQAEWRRQMEAEPVRFFLREMPPLLDESRRVLAELIGGEPENLVFTTNATAAINAVLRSLKFKPGDEILGTDHGYNACNNVVRYVAERSGASLAVAEISLPIASPQDVIDAILARVTPRTRLALIDHVTSPTAAVFPIKEIVEQLAHKGIDTLVDGAHGPGMVPIDVQRIGAAYYAGNCHKWLCAPKGAGFLYARPDRQEQIQPPIISHGFNQPRSGYTRFQDAFDWPGTTDPTAWLCVGEAIHFLREMSGCVGGQPAPADQDRLAGLMRHNHELVMAASRMICQRLGAQPTCNPSMTGSMSAILLPEHASTMKREPCPIPGEAMLVKGNPSPETRLGFRTLDGMPATAHVHRFYHELLEEFGIEVPVYYWSGTGQVILRISAQAYNNLAQYERLADALTQLVARGK